MSEPDTLSEWERASDDAEAAREVVAEAALRHVATALHEQVPGAMFLEVSFGGFGEGLLAESLLVDQQQLAGDDLPELDEDVHEALDDLNEYNARIWMPFLVGDEDDDEVGALDLDDLDDLADEDGPPLLIDLTRIRERLG